MAIKVQGAVLPVARAVEIATERFSDATQRQMNPYFFFDKFCLEWVLGMMDLQTISFVSTNDFISEVVTKTVEQHTTLTALKAQWKGRTGGGYIKYSGVPLNYRAAVSNLMATGSAAPGHDRGAHTTCPCATGGGTAREYDLSAARDGRLTVRNFNGRKGFYYSRHHAASTYEYLLVTDAHDRPLLRGTGIGLAGAGAVLMKVPVS